MWGVYLCSRLCPERITNMPQGERAIRWLVGIIIVVVVIVVAASVRGAWSPRP